VSHTLGKVGRVDPDRLLDGLNEAQRRAVTSPVVPLCILAGAGSGKTRVLTRRIAYRAATGQHEARRVLALTFTRKAAGELSSRLRQLGLRDTVQTGTFHAVAFAQLRARWADRNITPPTLLERKVGFVARLLPSSAGGSRGRSGRDTLPLDVVAEIEWAKARRVTPAKYAAAASEARRKPPIDAHQLANVFDRYEQEKKQRRMVDFDDLLRLCVRDLTRDEPFAEAQRWRYRHLFVDEYQDVNPLQQALLDAWLGDRRDLCVVGDPNQAIYAWNGADAGFLEDFGERWTGSEIVRLNDNYRSSPQVLTVANAVLAGAVHGRPGARGPSPTDVGELQANRPDGPIPELRGFADDMAEARAIARAVRDLRRPGSPWSAQAVLVRTNAQTAVIEECLRRVQIPVRTRGGTALLDQPEVTAALRELRQGGSDLGAALADLEAASREITASSRPADAGDDDASADPAADSRAANVQALVRLGHDFLALDPAGDVGGFLAWLSSITRTDQVDAHGDAVEIATFHAAKGLEWPIVHLAGIEQGLVPIGHAQTPTAQAEERRLFYVAVTRAEQVLRITWADNRTFGTRTVARERSPYLDQVDEACRALRAGEVPGDWRAFFADRRAETDRAAANKAGVSRVRRNGRAGGALIDLDEPQRELFEALKQWRAGVARASSVPAYVVFHDTTLEAIAQDQPRTSDDLLAVSGVGPVKVNRYGAGVLAVVADHAGD